MFIKAKPIFLKDLSKGKNIFAKFQSSFICLKKVAVLRVTGATFYRIMINEKFVHYGPARAPHNYMRVDEIDVTKFLISGRNKVSIEVISYNVNSFYNIMHEGFLIAEICYGDEVLCATGYDFKGYRNISKLQKVMRYSYQRHFTEVYNMMDGQFVETAIEEVKLSLKTLHREVPFPDYDIIRASYIKICGKFKRDLNITLTKNRFIEDISDKLLGFQEYEIEVKPFYDYQQLVFEADSNHNVKVFKKTIIKKNQYVVLDMTRNYTGFILGKILASTDAQVLISFEEYMDKHFVDLKRLYDKNINILYYYFTPGEHSFETIEVYGFRYIQVSVVEGEVELLDLAVREYTFPKIIVPSIHTNDLKLRNIYYAAIETFRQNTLDVFMDCPTRERAGWLCDSYYTAKAEYAFTGKTCVEKVFMENFILCRNVPNLPFGMLAMAYPGDFFDGNHIPQWSMWYILQLYEYLNRNPYADKDMFRALCYDLLKYLKFYQNQDGLLEKLPGWNFVEWSKANDRTEDVNYPTNMLYAKVLEIIGTIYEDYAFIKQANIIRNTIVEQSFNGSLFTDNAVRNNKGQLINTGNISEVCQYYALLFNTADLNHKKYKKLKEIILNVFGPNNTQYPQTGFDIEPANAFMGIYLRMELLLREKKYDKLLEEIKEYFGNMSALTGTLWEHNHIKGSLNHGFASYVGVVIQEVLKLKDSVP